MFFSLASVLKYSDDDPHLEDKGEISSPHYSESFPGYSPNLPPVAGRVPIPYHPEPSYPAYSVDNGEMPVSYYPPQNTTRSYSLNPPSVAERMPIPYYPTYPVDTTTGYGGFSYNSEMPVPYDHQPFYPGRLVDTPRNYVNLLPNVTVETPSPYYPQFPEQSVMTSSYNGGSQFFPLTYPVNATEGYVDIPPNVTVEIPGPYYPQFPEQPVMTSSYNGGSQFFPLTYPVNATEGYVDIPPNVTVETPSPYYPQFPEQPVMTSSYNRDSQFSQAAYPVEVLDPYYPESLPQAPSVINIPDSPETQSRKPISKSSKQIKKPVVSTVKPAGITNKSASWDAVYIQAMDGFLSLLKRNDFLFAMSQALTGASVEISMELVEEINNEMAKIQLEYQHHLNKDPRAAKEALQYFFEREIPTRILELLDLQSYFPDLILNSSHQTSLDENKVIVDAYLHQLSKVLEWKKNNLKVIRQNPFSETEYFTLMLSKTNEGFEVYPAFFKFSDSFSIESVHTDFQKAFSHLKNIFFRYAVTFREDRVILTELQFSTFYEHLKKVGPCYIDQGRSAEFWLIPRGKTIVEIPKEHIQPNKAKIPTRSRIPSLGSSKAYKSNDPYVVFFRSQGIKALDNWQRKNYRKGLFSKASKFLNLPTELSQFLAQTPKPENRETKFYIPGLMDYQKEIVDFLLKLQARGLSGGLLGADTGLGKTVMMLEIFLQLSTGPAICVSTKSTMLQTVYIFRKFMGETIIQMLKSIQEELLEASLETSKLKHYYICLSRFPLSLAKNIKTLNEKICRSEESQSYNERQILLAEGFLERANAIFQVVKNRIPQFQISEEDVQECLKARPEHLWNFNLFEDILDMDDLEKLLSKQGVKNIQGQNKLVVVTNKGLAKYQDVVASSFPQVIFADEAQNVNNPKTNNFKTLKNLKCIFETKGHRAFFIFSSATLFMHAIENLLSYLEIVTPLLKTKQIGVLSMAHLSSVIPQQLDDLAKQFYKICSSKAKTAVEEKVLFNLYSNVKTTFSSLESFKHSLNAVTISKKKTDEEVRRQWNNRIPLTNPVSHEFNLSEQQRELVSIEENKFDTASKKNRNFFAYFSNVFKILFHPDIYLRPGPDLLKELREKTWEELVEWGKASPLINYFLTDPDFETHVKEGTLIYVDETIKGKILKLCLKKRFPGKHFSYLTGKTSALRRREMAQRFEEAEEGEPNALFANIMAASAGLDFPKKGRHVYFPFDDFNRKRKDQGANRFSRVNSDKKVIHVHSFRFPVKLQKTLDWHAEKKIITENYYLSQFSLDQSNFERMLAVIPYGIKHDLHTESLEKDLKKLINLITQFTREDPVFNQDVDKGKEKVKEEKPQEKRPYSASPRKMINENENVEVFIAGAKRKWRIE